MEEKGLKAKDLEPIIGSNGHVSLVLSGKREVTLKMAKALRVFWEYLLTYFYPKHISFMRDNPRIKLLNLSFSTGKSDYTGSRNQYFKDPIYFWSYRCTILPSCTAFCCLVRIKYTCTESI